MTKSTKLLHFLNAELSLFPLPKRFVTALNKINCFTVGQTIFLGRKRVANLKSVGIVCMTEFDYLLINHDCQSMFV
jgi:hypothetical protein